MKGSYDDILTEILSVLGEYNKLYTDDLLNEKISASEYKSRIDLMHEIISICRKYNQH